MKNNPELRIEGNQLVIYIPITREEVFSNFCNGIHVYTLIGKDKMVIVQLTDVTLHELADTEDHHFYTRAVVGNITDEQLERLKEVDDVEAVQ